MLSQLSAGSNLLHLRALQTPGRDIRDTIADEYVVYKCCFVISNFLLSHPRQQWVVLKLDRYR